VNARVLTALTLLAAAAIAVAAEPPAPEKSPAAETSPAPEKSPAPQQSPATETSPAASSSETPRVPGPGPVDPAPPAAPEPPKPPPARTISGQVTSVEQTPPRVVVDATGGPVAIALDRNTAIYLKKGWGTVRDVSVGEQVRASISGAENRALWLEVLTSGAPAEKAEGSALTPPTIPPGEMSAPAGQPGTVAVPPSPATPGTTPGP
jgi:hypothetical protein